MRDVIAKLLWFCFAIGATATLAGLAGSLTPQLEMFNQVQPFALAGFATIFALALGTKSGRLMVATGLGVLANAGIFAIPFSSAATVAELAPAQRTFTLMSANIMYDNRDYETALKSIGSADPDILVLSEFLAHHNANMAHRLAKNYPFQANCPRSNIDCDVALFSKWPFDSTPELTPYTRTSPSAINVVVRTPNAETIRMVAMHVDFPGHLAKQQADLRWLADKARAWPETLVIAGDLNLTPWTKMLQRLQRETGLVRHGTLQRSWPVKSFPPNIPFVLIDNVLTTANVRSVSFETGIHNGSDHLPIVARLAPH